MDNIKHNKEEIICQRKDIVIGKNDKNLESRYIMIPGYNYPYEHYKENNSKNISISILQDLKDNFNIDTIFWSIFALESHLIKKNL